MKVYLICAKTASEEQVTKEFFNNYGVSCVIDEFILSNSDKLEVIEKQFNEIEEPNKYYWEIRTMTLKVA